MSPQKIIAIVMLVSLMMGAGLEISREHLIAVLKNYSLLARALLANFIIVPVLGVLIARVFHLDEYVAIGFLLMAIAPGVPFLVQAAGRKPGGSLGLATALAFIMPALSILTIPLTTRLIFPPDAQAHVPFVQLVVTLVVFQLVPLLIGLLIADRAPTIAGKLQRPLLLLFVVTLVVLLVALGPALLKAVASVYGSRGMLAILAITLLSLVSGWVFGGPSDEYRRTLSIATCLRNIGACAVIATASFPDTLVAPTVLTYLLIQVLVSSLFAAYLKRTATPAGRAIGSVT
jgi:BASS family bile acid:Na+ symporter